MQKKNKFNTSIAVENTSINKTDVRKANKLGIDVLVKNLDINIVIKNPIIRIV